MSESTTLGPPPSGSEIKIVAHDGTILQDGVLEHLDGLEVHFAGGRMFRPTRETGDAMAIVQTDTGGIKPGQKLMAVHAFNCGGSFVTTGYLTKPIVDTTATVSPTMGGKGREIDLATYQGGIYRVFADLPSAPEAVIMNLQSKSVATDGKFDRLEGTTVHFVGGRAVELDDTVALLVRTPLAEVQPDQRVLLVERWGCGGMYMQEGYLGNRLSATLVCFGTTREGKMTPVDLSGVPHGVYRIEWSPETKA